MHCDLTDVLDGAMIVLAMFTLNFLHPGLRFRGVASPLKSRGEKTDGQLESQPGSTTPTDGGMEKPSNR
jgi:hypothetical protein